MSLIAITLNISQFFMPKETGHSSTMFLQAMHEFLCFVADLFFGMWNNPAVYVCFRVWFKYSSGLISGE